MPISIATLCRALKPSRTALLLGAGASVPSGAPSGRDLAHLLWREVAKSEPSSDDLVETSSLLERRFQRIDVITAVVSRLRRLKPTGGLLGLPQFGWDSVFTTNFDQLLESAFKSCGIPLAVVSSNYDFTNKEGRTETTLYKLHGCISQDRALGNKPSMILTEQDYEDFDKYRQTLFQKLNLHLLSGDILVIGQSLRDPHLADLVKRALKFKEQGAPGEIYALIYDKDDLRAQLLEDRGAKIAFGGIDDFVNQMAETAIKPEAVALSTDQVLPLSIISIVDDVSLARLKEPNVVRMFNGGAASFADIRANATFERAIAQGIISKIEADRLPLITLVGAAGVGKTTLGRQLLTKYHEAGSLAFEHKGDYAFKHQPWIDLESKLRADGRKAVLLLDECTKFLRQVNLLVDHLATVPGPALTLVLTANAAQWGLRVKSPQLLKNDRVVNLTRLVDGDIHQLINLLHANRQVGDLIHASFRNLHRGEQFSRLRGRCSADMFVCLKNIFANDSLDNILLAEYDQLETSAQEHYRYIAALESVGMRVHRLLVTRLLGLRPDQVTSVLSGLTGIVDESEIDEKEGIYGWSTRHIVIARKITEYKFSSLDEVESLFRSIIDNINPAIRIELQSIRDLCDRDYGIGRLGDSGKRKALYRDLIELAPAERSPWHRLIRELLDERQFEDVEYVIRDAIEAVGQDAPIDRFRVRLLILRAEHTPGLADKDRLAILRKAYETAKANVLRHANDKYSYRIVCQVADKLIDHGESYHLLVEATEALRSAAADLCDPELDGDVRQYESRLAQLSLRT